MKEAEKLNNTSKRWRNYYGNGKGIGKIRWIIFFLLFLSHCLSDYFLQYLWLIWLIKSNYFGLHYDKFFPFFGFIMFGVFIRGKKSKLYSPIVDGGGRFCGIYLTDFIRYSKYITPQIKTCMINLKNLTLSLLNGQLFSFIIVCFYMIFTPVTWTERSSFWDSFLSKKLCL